MNFLFNRAGLVLSVLMMGALVPRMINAQVNNMEMSRQIRSTPAIRPLTVVSNESTKEQLLSARAEGDSIDKCINWLKRKAKNAGQLNSGEYKITYILSAPEGWYEFQNGKISWKDPGGSNAHFWLFVQDGADGRIVPPLDIHLTILNARGSVVEAKDLPFAWMPLINGYGNNIDLPSSGSYTFKVEIDPQTFHRHDPYNGDRFTKKVTAILPVTLSSLSNLNLLSTAMEDGRPLAENAGKAYSNTLKTMYAQANDGRDTVSGDYFVACAVEYSEGYWFNENSSFQYKSDNEQSSIHNGHVEIVARDRKTGRFLHNMMVHVELSDENNKKIGSKMEMFMWHPWLYHYGENWRVPKEGYYNVHIHIDPPLYRRYGKRSGKQFTDPVNLVFNHIKIKTGQK